MFTCRRYFQFVLAIILGLLVVSGSGYALAETWSFGVLGDTQWSPAGPEDNSVAIHIIDAVNRQFIDAKVDLVLQVGDLTDKGSKAAMNTRAAHNRALSEAGIAFYPLRGNHEGKPEAAGYFSEAFPNLPGTPGNGGSSPALPGAAGRTYAFVHKGVKFILLDQFALIKPSSQKGYTIADYQPWIEQELAAADHEHAFVLAHKNLLGQNHKDNLFGQSNDDNPEMQSAFITGLDRSGVRYFWSGHDHIHHRALVTGPDGAGSAQQIICASCSHKFYTPRAPFSPREAPLQQEMNRIGYYIATVDGPRLTVRYYSAPEFGAEPATPAWTLQETFGYSLNGKSFVVPRGESYVSVADLAPTDGGFSGTKMQILGGKNENPGKTHDGRPLARLVCTGWSPKSGEKLASDILSLWGLEQALGSARTDTYVLSMAFDRGGRSEADLVSGQFGVLARDSAGGWTLAVAGNQEAPKFVAGPWKSEYGLGTYGVDLKTGSAWAVVDRAGEFAVGSR